MNEMLERIAKVIDEGGPYKVQYYPPNDNFQLLCSLPGIGVRQFGLIDNAENECERLNREYVARRVVEVMKLATTFQQNNYYEIALKEGSTKAYVVFQNAVWERMLDAIISDTNTNGK